MKSMGKRYDLVVLGGGTAAFSAIIRADRNNAKTLMIDGGTIGGTCVNVGCVPSKRLLAVGDQFFRLGNRAFEGIRLEDGWSNDFGAVIRSKDRLVDSLRKSKYVDVLGSLEDVDYLTNVEALSLKERPDSMIVVGGRALGLEFAQMYQHLGTQVTVLQRSSESSR